MITLTIYVYFFVTGQVEWNSDIALGLGAFDVLMATFLTDLTIIEFNGGSNDG